MKLAAVSETMTGEMPGQNTPATAVLAMIEQGLKVFTSIYKRVFRSLKAEYKKLYRLNRLYMDEEEYVNVLDDRQVILRKDYDMNDLDIVPVADPTISSEAQRLARAQALLNTLSMNPTIGGKVQILKYYYDAITGMPEMTKKLLPEQELSAPPPPNPELLELQLKTTESQARTELEYRKMNLEQIKSEAEIEAIFAKSEQMYALAVKALADAQSVSVGDQFEKYRIQLDKLGHDLEAWKVGAEQKIAQEQAAKVEGNQPGGTSGDIGNNESGGAPGMVTPPNNGEGPPTSGELAGAVPEPAPEGSVPDDGISPENRLADLRASAHDLRARQNT
jgi:chaperonin GroES